MKDDLISNIRQQLHGANRVLLASHIRPDGDALGSMLGLGLALQAVGIEVQMVSIDGVPSALKHLPGSDQIRNRPVNDYDLFVTLDSSDMQRLGEPFASFPPPDINIDHHITNLGYGKLNLVEADAVATAEILALYLPKFDLPVNEMVAKALLTGIITDTIGFRTSNMTPRALRVAADLMEKGADLPELYTVSLLRRSFEAASLWGVGLKGLQRKGPIVYTEITAAERKAVGYLGRDDADLINTLALIDNAQVVILFNEENNYVKISWRAQSDLDVSKIALQFGGGGHRAAAGAEIQGSLEEVKALVLEATQSLFSEDG